MTMLHNNFQSLDFFIKKWMFFSGFVVAVFYFILFLIFSFSFRFYGGQSLWWQIVILVNDLKLSVIVTLYTKFEDCVIYYSKL